MLTKCCNNYIRFMLTIGVVAAFLLAAPRSGWASFEVDWANESGGHAVASWFIENGYYSAGQYSDALSYAKTGYIGHKSSDPDGFLWNASMPVTFEIVGEESAHADYSTLGYYTGTGGSKVLNQVFGGLENGPKTLSINEPFGLYLGIWDNINWFTDRSENNSQSGLLKNLNGDAQSLIYELKPGQEWLVAWEDIDTTSWLTDTDFNDMFVKVTYAPEPVSSTLFLLGGGALAVSRFRKKQNSVKVA